MSLFGIIAVCYGIFCWVGCPFIYLAFLYFFPEDARPPEDLSPGNAIGIWVLLPILFPPLGFALLYDIIESLGSKRQERLKNLSKMDPPSEMDSTHATYRKAPTCPTCGR